MCTMHVRCIKRGHMQPFTSTPRTRTACTSSARACVRVDSSTLFRGQMQHISGVVRYFGVMSAVFISRYRIMESVYVVCCIGLTIVSFCIGLF